MLDAVATLYRTDLPAKLIFKGGTSLSKVFRAVERFSEDIDLSFDRTDLGFGGVHDPASAKSNKKRRRELDELRKVCQQVIQKQALPLLVERLADTGVANWSVTTSECKK